MRTILRKLFGASTGGGASLSFFVLALTGLIAGAPLVAGAQEAAGPNVVTFSGKTADTIATNGDGPLEFVRLESQASTRKMVEWVAEPEQTGKNQAAFTGGFTFRLDGLRQVGDQAPNPLPQTASLSAVTVEFLVNKEGSANQNVRHLTLTDEAGSVLAVSAEADPIPTGSGTQQIVFSFPGLSELSLSTLYKGHFTATAPEVGSTFDASSDVRTRISFYQDQTAIDVGNQVNGWPAYCLAASFSLQAEVEEPLGALNINFDTNANRLDAGTLYGLDGVQYPGAQWNTITGSASATDVGVTDTLGNALSVTYLGQQLLAQERNTDLLLKAVLQDYVTDGPNVQIDGIPYERYDAYVYMTSDTHNWGNSPVRVNGGDYYIMEEGQETATVVDGPDGHPWAAGKDLATVALGTTVMRIANLSGEQLTLNTWRNHFQANGRGNIAAIQIVEVATPERDVWEGTLADGKVSGVTVQNTATGETATLPELGADDEVSLSCAGDDANVYLRVDAAVEVAALTFNVADGVTLTVASEGDLSIAAGEIALTRGTLEVTEGALASENPVDLAEGTVCRIRNWGEPATFTQALTGAGAVEIAAGYDVTLGADFTHTGGTTVSGEGAVLRYGGHALGAVTVGQGGVFDLNGNACDCPITLDGGTLRAEEPIAEILGVSYVASVNFNPTNGTASGSATVPDDAAGRIGETAAAGLVPTFGEYWLQDNSTPSATNLPLSFYAANAVQTPGSAAAYTGTIGWDSNDVYYDTVNPPNQTNWLVGYLDDTGTHTATVTVPPALAGAGYDLYLYSSGDVATGTYAARVVNGTRYTYSNGILTVGNAGWGDRAAGRTTVAEGTNAMVIPGLTDETLTIDFGTQNNIRGGLPALQIHSNAVASGNFAGMLSVIGADSTIEVAEGVDVSFAGAVTVSGEGTLGKSGAGTLTLVGAVTGDLTVDAGVLALGEADIAGAVTVNAGQLRFDAGSYAGLTVDLRQSESGCLVSEGVTALTLGALAGSGELALTGAQTLTLAGAAEDATFSGTLSADGGLTLVKQGENTQRLEGALPGLSVVAEGGTLDLASLGTVVLAGLETRGGDVTGTFSATAYAEMAAGNVSMDAPATAASARPAAETADAATVSNFTLAEGGELRYEKPADRNLYFPEGFIPRGSYKLVLGEAFADSATFPFSFTVLGADRNATFTVCRADGTEAPASSYTAIGTTITVWDVGAVIDYSDDLPEAKFRYTFNESANNTFTNLGSAGTAGDLRFNANAGVQCTEEGVENGAAIQSGYPWTREWNLVLGESDEANAWTAGFYLTLGEEPPANVILWATAANGGNSTNEGSFFLATGEEPGTLTLWRRVSGAQEEVATVDLNAARGGASMWHQVLLAHSPTRIRFYVDGGLAAERAGDFAGYNQRGFQIGSYCGTGPSEADTGLSRWTAVNGVKIDELTLWPAALRDAQIDKALATTTAAWRSREGTTFAELFAADAPWARTNGSSDVFAAAGEDASDLTARATLTLKGTADDLFAALQGFTARNVLLDGEPLTHALFADSAARAAYAAPALPDTVGSLVVDNDLTIDLSGVDLMLAAQIAAKADGFLLLPGLWHGALSLANVPEGFDFALDLRADGLYLVSAVSGSVASINFHSDNDRLLADDEVGGLVPMRGAYWVKTTGATSDAAATVAFYDLAAASDADAAPTGDSVSVTWAAGGVYQDDSNPTKYLKGYLDDNGSPSTVTLTVPEAIAKNGYDVYLYSSVDATGGSTFSARDVTGDDGVTTSYSYVDGVLTAGSTAGWGSAADGRTTVAEGVNVMRLPARTDETLTIAFSRRNGRGGLAAIQIVKLANLYVRSVEGTEAWVATDAWTKVADGSPVDEPPEGATLMVEATDAAILTVSAALPAYDALTVVGGGTLTLSVDGQSLLTDDDYKRIPRGQAHTATILDAAIDPAQVSAWVSALKYGATAAVSVAEGGITAAVTLPDAAYPSDRPDESESISFNFTNYSNRGSGGVGAIADDAMGASGTPYATYGVYWLEPTETTSKTEPRTETLSAPVVLNTARGAADADTTKTASVTYNVYHGWGSGIGGTAQPILQAFANGHSLSGGGGGGGIPFVSVSVPEDWGDYTAVVYMSTDTGSPSWLPKRVNGAFYYYTAAGELATLTDETHADTVGGLPDEVKDTTYAWGRPTEDGSLVEGTNMMVIPGLSGDFKLEFWSKPNAANNNVDVSQTQGRVAAFQLIEDGLDNLPDLDAVQVYQAELAGEADWADLDWTINGEPAEDTPGAGDAVALTLTGDATLTFGAATTVDSITVYGQGHALRVADADNATAAWTFRNDAILALGEGDTLPATIATNPKRVRYDYAYEADYAATAAYETEFAAGFSGNLGQINVGFVEFSGGDVVIGRMTSGSGTATGTLVFSGDAALTMTDDVNAAGLRIGNTDVIFRDNAAATLSRIHMRGESATHSSITVEDNAAITVTGATNGVSNYNTLQFGDWGGTSALTLRDNARFVAAAADLMLGGSVESAAGTNGATVTLEDDAEMRVAGVANYNQSSGAIVLNGGSFLVGSRGFRAYSPTSTSVLSVAFNGGALGAWADWTWGADTAAIVTTVTGDPILAPAQGVTLTVAEGANLFDAVAAATLRGEGTVVSARSALPALTLEGGTFESKVAAQAPSVSLSGGALALSGGALRLADGLETHGVGSVRIPLSPSGVAGWLAMAEGGPVPDVSDVVFTLALDLSGEDALLPYQVPLFLGACDTADAPTIAGVMLENNAAGAITAQTPVYAAGAQGLGLYLTLSGNAVLQPHTVALDDTVDGYRATQAVADTYGYWIFDGQAAGARLLLPTDTLRFREVAFRGQPMTLVASGDEPHLLLQARGLTVNTPLTIDLSAWAGALDAFVSGAVDGLPCSLCLIAADTLTLNEVVVTLDGYEPPEGCTLEPVATDRGVYLVARAAGARPAQALSVNFASRAVPLAAPPAAPGAYAVPVAAWNGLAGSFFSADLRVSDLAGVASIPAVGANGQNTQLSATAAAVVSDATAPATLIQVWLTDDAAQTVRVANIPFARYRLALVFAADFAGAAYAPVTVGADVYAMDAAGYTRKNVLAYAKTGALGDTAWGSTARDGLSAEDPDVLGLNTLVTDVLEGSAVDIALPQLVYGRTYAGLAALQIVEAPEPEADAGEGTAYAYTFTANAPEAALADLDLTIEDGTTARWQSGPENTLALTVPEGVSATLTLPLNFRAKTLSVSGAGDLTLLTESDGGILLGTLDAGGLTGALTVRCPCVGVAFTPGAGVSRFEAAFDNDGQAYTIAAGATLAFGADSGIAVSLDGGTTLDRADGAVTLLVDPASTGTLRRDYAESFNTDWSDTSYRNQTWAFRDLAAASGREHVVFSPDLLIEDGDVWSLPDAGIWLQSGANHKTAATLVQTGGTVEIDTIDGANHGFLVASNDDAGLALDFDLSGGRFAASQLMGWGPNASLDLDVTGTGVLALGNGDGNYAGSIAARVASVTMDVAVTDGGVFEPLASTVSAGSAGTHALTFGPGGAIRFGSDTPAEVDMTMPVTFAGATTIDPGVYGTLVLDAANTAESTAALDVPRGTLALADASGLGEATVTVASGAAFEARGFTGEGEGSEEARTVPVVAIKLDIPAGVGNSDGTAIQELCLYNNDTKVAWPSGTTISGTGRNNTPNWAAGGNEAINALIDGVTGGVASPGTWTKPEDGSTGAYTGNAKNNKWYPITNTTGTASATITIGGDGVVFDSYTLWCSDSQSRFPSAWTLSVRYAGDAEDSWTVLHAPTGQNRPAANTESEKYAVTLRTEGGATELDEVSGKVVFEAGAQCRAVRKTGVTGLPYVARIAGSIDVAKGPRYFLDGEEFAADAVEVDEASGLVTFNEGGALDPTAVTWDITNASGTWQDGVAGPWVGGATFINGAAVTFPDVTQPTVATVAGSVKPGTVTFEEGTTTAYYTFAGDEDAVLDLSTQTPVNVGSTTNQYIDFAAGAGTTFDVPIATSGAGVGINLPNGAVRLVGALSDNNRTATLLGSGNLNEAGQHGVWHASGDLTLMPRAGETQRLSAYSGQLYGDGTIIVQGQVANDGTVSGGTVEFGGTSPSGLVNNAFTGAFVVRDGATLVFTMTRADGGDNPFFQASDGTPLYKGDAVGFTLRNGGVLRFSGHRGFLGGWGQISNSTPDLWTSQPIVIGYRSALECVYGSGTYWQHTPYGLRFDGDGATLLIDDGTASGLGMDFVRGATLTVAGIGDAGDPDDPKTTDGKLTQGITATIETVEGATMRIFGDNGQDDALFLDVGEGSTLRLAADIGSTIPDGSNQTDPAPFVKRGPGRLELTWPTIGNVVEVEVEEGALGGDAELTSGSVSVASGATVEAGLSLAELSLAGGASVAVDPTGARQLRASTVTFPAGAVCTVQALDDPPPAAGREPVKVFSWSSAANVANVSLLVDDRLTKAGYGAEIRSDGLYLAPAVTYVRLLDGALNDATYDVLWFESIWRRIDGGADDYTAFVPYAPAANETANVVFVVPDDISSVGIRAILDGEVSFASVRFARGEFDGEGNLTGIGADCGGSIEYVYDLTNAEMPGERETLAYAFLPSLAYFNNGTLGTATFTEVLLPDGYQCSIDGVTATVYLGTGGETGAINVSFTGGSEGSASWIDASTEPCGAVLFAGAYWNNASTMGGSGLESLILGGGYRGYRLTPRLSGVSGDLADAPTVRYAFTAGRAVAGRTGLAAGFLPGPGAAADPDEIGFIEDSGISSAGWAVRVDNIPFARYDLYLLFAGSGDGAATYPAVRVKPGTGAWRTYAFRNGWTAPAGSGDAWAGQAVLDEGFADGANLLHLRIEGGGTLQIVPHDGANGNNAEVGLAALQIVELPQGEPAFYAAQGPTWSGQTWDYTATGANGASQAVRDTAWQDATQDAPHYALVDGVGSLNVDRAASLPFLRVGAGTLTLSGTAGALSVGALDLYEADAAVTVAEDVFAQAPNVLLGDAVTLVPFPEAAADTALGWRWVYPEGAAHTATLSKQGAYGLTLTQSVDNNLRIDAGTLWLTAVSSDANTDYPRAISGAGTLGWAGTGTLRVAFNNLPDGSADEDGVFLRAAGGGTVTLAAVANSSLPSGGTVEVSDGATLQFNNNTRGVNQRPFPNGTFLARDGGIVHYNGSDASNTFKNDGAVTQLPSVRLEGGLFQQTIWQQSGGTNASVHDVYELVSSGDSRYYLASAGSNAWNHKTINVRSGRIQVEEGTLGIHSSLGNGTGSKNSVVLLPNADTSALYGDGSSTTHGYLDVATGAALFSHYPIYAGTGGSNNTLAKVGGGVWVQTQNICQTVGYNGGGNGNTGGTDPYDNIEIREGTFRLNMGDDVLEVPADTAARTITVASGARLDGTGTVSDDFSVTIERGATLSSGLPADAVWVPGSSQWNANFPNHFKQPAGRTGGGVYLDFQGSLSFADGAILEVDLAQAAASTNALVRVSGEGARVSLGSSLTVRLTNLQTAFNGPVKLTNFAVDPNSRPTVNCPEAIALDGAVQWLTDAEALGDESANATVHNLWLIASGDSYVWADPNGDWSDEAWTHQGATTTIVNGITAPEDAPKARVVADSADVALTVDQDPGEPNSAEWGVYGLVLSAAQGRGVTLAQGGQITGSESAPEGKLYGLRIDSSLWKVGGGTAQVDALAWLDNAATLTVDAGSLTFTRPLLRGDLSAGQEANTLGAALSVAQGSTLTFAFAEPSPTERAYFEGLGLENPQALTLNGSFSGAGTLRVEGEGTAVTLAAQSSSAARQDGALSYSVGAGATLTLQGDTPASTGDATPRAVTVEGGGILGLGSERALGATTAWTWSLGDGALVTTADDARIRGAVALDAGTATLGRDSQQWDGDLSVTVGEGATLTFAGNIQTPDDAPAAATFTKRGAGTAVIDQNAVFDAGLNMDVAEGTLRVDAGSLSVTPGERGVTPAWTVRDGATLAIGGGTRSFSNGSLTVEGGGVLDCAANVVTLNNSPDRPTVLADGATLRFGDGTTLNEGTALTVRTALRVEGRVTVEVDVADPSALRQPRYTLLSFATGARLGTGTFVLGGANAAALAVAGWTLEDNGQTVSLVSFDDGTGYVWAGTTAGWLDADAWVPTGGSEPITWGTGTQGAVSFLDEQPIGGVEVPGEYRTVGSTGTQTVTALRALNGGGDYALEGSGGLTVQGLLLKTGASGLTFRRPVTLGNSGSLNVQGGTVTFENTVGTTDAPDALAVPVTLGQGATLAFVGGRARTLSGTLEADASAILSNADGTLTLACAVPGLTLRATGGTLALTAADQALALGGVDAPTFDLSGNAALTLGGTLSGGGTVAPRFSEGTRGVTLRWAAAASAESASVPRLGDLGEAVSTLVYAPRSGHLILDPGSLMDGAALSLENDALETTALWLGAGNGAGDEAIRLSALTATGAACIGVEPARALSGGSAWAGERTLTLALSGDASFGGTFVGADDDAGAIRAGLTLEKADPAAAGTPTFTYSGESTAGTVGTLTAGAGVRVSVTGEWAGAATAEDGGVLGGSGTLGAVALGAGARLSAAAADVRGELAPATLTLGSLELGAGAGLEVLARVDEASGATELSLVQVAGTCRLGANDLALNVYLDLEEGAAVNTRKILGWDTLDGYQSVSATVYVRGADGAWQESGDYFVRRGGDGLYLHRASARFWMILR